MEWIECTLPWSGDTDELCTALAELGVGGMSVENEADFKDFLENNHQYWDYVDEELEQSFAGKSQVKFWLADDEEGRAVLAAVTAAGYTVTTSLIHDEDWENNWKEFYKPLPIGEKLIVVPEWEEAELDGRIALRLDPGLIFGTGSHATTRMCLEALEHMAAPGMIILMHDMQKKSPLYTADVLPYLADQQFMFVTVPELYAHYGVPLEPNTEYDGLEDLAHTLAGEPIRQR